MHRVRIASCFAAIAAIACNPGSGMETHGPAIDAGPAYLTDASGTSDPRVAVDANVSDVGAIDGGSAVPIDAAGSSDAAAAPTPLASDASTWKAQTIYLVMPDRFADGDTTNDELGTANCFDPSDPSKYHGGDLAGLRAKIPYLAELGVTAVWITPQYKSTSDRCGYHGYWADFVDPDDGAIEPRMGTSDDLVALANALHAANIRLVLDMVVNHSGRTARIDAQHPDWFHDASTCMQSGDPAVTCPVGGLPLPDFAQENPDVATYLNAMSVRWMQTYGIDGIRMDTVKNVGHAYWSTSWFPAIRAARASVFTVGEVFDESGPSALLPYLNDGFDSLFDYPRYAAIVSTFGDGGSVDTLANAVANEIATYGFDRTLMMTSFADNHDNPRLTSIVPAGTIDANVSARFRLALASVFTLPGIPEIMWGDELAMYGAADPDNRHDMPAWAWSATERAGAHPGFAGDGASAFQFAKTLIATRALHPALQTGSYAEMWRQDGGVANVFAYHRGAGSDHVVVAINAGTNSASVALHVATSGTLSASDKTAMPEGAAFDDALHMGAPSTIAVASGMLALTLPPQTAGVYVLR